MTHDARTIWQRIETSGSRRQFTSYAPYIPRGSKYPTFEDSGSKNCSGYGFWDQRPETLNMRHLDPLGWSFLTLTVSATLG